jgi:hypothetical protein
MGDMAQDFVTLTAKAVELEAINKGLADKVTELAKTNSEYANRIDGLVKMRNDLQKANSDYLEQARKNRAEDRKALAATVEQVDYWREQYLDQKHRGDKAEHRAKGYKFLWLVFMLPAITSLFMP